MLYRNMKDYEIEGHDSFYRLHNLTPYLEIDIRRAFELKSINSNRKARRKIKHLQEFLAIIDNSLLQQQKENNGNTQ